MKGYKGVEKMKTGPNKVKARILDRLGDEEMDDESEDSEATTSSGSSASEVEVDSNIT